MTGGDPLDVETLLADIHEPTPEGHRAGMVALAGRPNVGKSTLLNRLVGEKVAIVTEVPGTTRNAIRGVVNRPDAQVVFLDTPGLAKPRTLLSRRLNDLVRETWSAVDVICFLVDVAAGVGRGDEFLAAELAALDTSVIAVANKEDAVADKTAMLPHLQRLGVNVVDKKLIGSGAWETVKIDEAQLENAIYPGRDRTAFADFAQRYEQINGVEPSVWAALGYDAVTLVTDLVRRLGPEQAFRPDAIENPRGYSGINGIFRLRSDGTTERGLAIYGIVGGEREQLVPAPTSFARGT